MQLVLWRITEGCCYDTWLWIETIWIPDTLVNNKITGCSFLHNHGHGIFHRFWSRAVCVFFVANSFEQHMVLRVNRNVNRTRQQRQTRSWYFGRGRWTLNATVESFMPKSQTFKFYFVLFFHVFFLLAILLLKDLVRVGVEMEGAKDLAPAFFLWEELQNEQNCV